MTNSKAKHMRVLHFVMSLYRFFKSMFSKLSKIIFFFIEGVYIIITTIEGMVGRQFGTSDNSEQAIIRDKASASMIHLLGFFYIRHERNTARESTVTNCRLLRILASREGLLIL